MTISYPIGVRGNQYFDDDPLFIGADQGLDKDQTTIAYTGTGLASNLRQYSNFGAFSRANIADSVSLGLTQKQVASIYKKLMSTLQEIPEQAENSIPIKTDKNIYLKDERALEI